MKIVNIILSILLQLLSKSLKNHLYILDTSAQQAEPYVLTRVHTLAMDKICNIYTVRWYVLGVSHDFGIFWGQWAILISSGNKS